MFAILTVAVSRVYLSSEDSRKLFTVKSNLNLLYFMIHMVQD